jgi:hypothetical protein
MKSENERLRSEASDTEVDTSTTNAKVIAFQSDFANL